MRLVDLLPARNGEAAHCRECDGPLLLTDDTECEECAGAGFVQRLEWRYQNGEGIGPMRRWPGVLEVMREFHPLYLAFGLDARLGREWAVTASFALWSLTIRADL